MTEELWCRDLPRSLSNSAFSEENLQKTFCLHWEVDSTTQRLHSIKLCRKRYAAQTMYVTWIMGLYVDLSLTLRGKIQSFLSWVYSPDNV